MYKKEKVLGSTALKRLEAIKEFTELGSGYKISMRDLAIRGAGDILGREQAGFIDSIGVNMYLDLINEEVNGVDTSEEDLEENKKSPIDVETHIGEEISDDSDVLIELHKKINAITNKKELEEVLFEIKDRFAHSNESLEIYAHEKYIERLISLTNIKVDQNDNLKVVLRLKKDVYSFLNIENLFYESTKISNKFNFTYKNDIIYITLLKATIGNNYIKYIEELLEKIYNMMYKEGVK
jgi:transcription-repair coupling factor (superfamily II helicase)